MNSVVKALAVAVISSQLVMVGNAVADDEMVNNYAMANGSVIVNSYGTCWRTSFKDTTEKLEECGYEKPMASATPPVAVEVVATPTAATITAKVMEKISLAASMLFGFDSAVLTDDAKLVIDERIERLNAEVKLTSIIEVRGYTCNMGPEEYNKSLSQKRAQAVADYIIANGKTVKTSDIKVIGMGEADPAATNDTKEGREQNRRVEIIAHGEIDK